jgi:tRNA threonylcarbamoyladenosine biosynthesis protein TsaE
MESFSIESCSPKETETIGARFAAMLPSGAVVALVGDLAAGKTCFVRGMASCFVINETVSSPTFTIVNQYGNGPKLYHVDLYRLGDVEELIDIGYEELMEPDGVSVIEWADRAGSNLPERRVDIRFEHVDEDARLLTFYDYGLLPSDWTERLQNGNFSKFPN